MVTKCIDSDANKMFWEICLDFKRQTDIKKDYLEYISAIIYIIFFKGDDLQVLEELYKKRNNYYIPEKLDSYLKEIQEQDNYLFPRIKFNEITTYRNIGEENILSKTIEKIYKLIIKLKNEYGEDSKKYLLMAYKHSLTETILIQDLSSRNGEIYTPVWIAKVMAGITIDKENCTLNDPYCGTGNILANIPDDKNIKLFGQEENLSLYNICKTYLMLNDVDNSNIIIKNNKKEIYLKKRYDYIISNPPFIEKNLKNSQEYGDLEISRDYGHVMQMLDSLKDDGKMAVILPHGVLFRESEKSARKYLIENNIIDTIIGLPENIFLGTRNSVIIMLLKKKRENKDILFIDASNQYKTVRKGNLINPENQQIIINTYIERKEVEEYSHVANIDEIVKNDYNLTIRKYIQKKIKKEKIDNEYIVQRLELLDKERDLLEENIKDVLEKLEVKDILKTYRKGEFFEHIDYEIIGQNIKNARRLRGYTMEELADQLNMSILYLSRIERGMTKIGLDTLIQICQELHVSIVDIMKD